MSVNVERLEKSMVKLTIEVSAEEFDKYVTGVYNKQKSKIQIQGFRKGKASRAIIEKVYGAGVFFQDAANDCINATYQDAAKESGEDIVSNPEIEVTQIEPGKSFIYTALVAVKPPVSLGKYKGVEIEAIKRQEVTDEDVDNELKRQQDANAKVVEVTDRPVQDGDQITLDFAGSVDGVAFDGGTATDYPLTIGSGSFIPGFEEQLIGAAIGEEKDVNVTFPEDYQAEDLAGKAALFVCTVKSIKEKQLPELNDEFADEVSEFSTLEEYKADIRKNIESRREEAAVQARQNAAVDAAVADAQVEIPEPMIATQAESLVNEFAQNLQMQGMNIQQYMQYTGMNVEQLIDQMKPQATTRIKNSLVLEAIAAAENITTTDEDFDAECDKIAAQYNMPVDNVKAVFADDKDKEGFLKDVVLRKAAELVAANAVEVERKEEPAEAPADAE